MIRIQAEAGTYITTVCEKAVETADRAKESVSFAFNGVEVIVQRGETAEGVESRWRRDVDADSQAYAENPQRLVEQAERERKDASARAAHMRAEAADEKTMREATVPTPLTEAQLVEYITSLVSREHDYGTSVYAISMAATAAFNYVASVLGATGFQASCADLDVLRRTRSLSGPFMIIKGEDALYPQYDLPRRLEKTMREWRPWLRLRAQELLAQDGNSAHPDVAAHWKILADYSDLVSEDREATR